MQKRTKSANLSAFLVLLSRTGDQKAFTALAKLHNPRLLSHAMRLLGDCEGARDCVQEAWVEIIRGLNGLRDPMVFQPWALRIVTRRVAREIGGRQRARRLNAGVKEMAETGSPEIGAQPADQAADQAADRATVCKAIARLPDDHKACVALFYLEEMRVAEVAVALDVPLGTVKTRLMHARKKLRAILERKE